MRRLGILLLMMVAATPAAVCGAMSAADQGDGPVMARGFYAVTFNVHLSTPVPAGASVICRAKVQPRPGAFGMPGREALPAETAAAVASVAGNNANCSLEIPFSWTVNDPRSGVALSYELDEVGGSGAAPALRRSSLRRAVTMPYPPTGGVANLRFHVTF